MAKTSRVVAVHPPGWKGVDQFAEIMRVAWLPWTPEETYTIYQEVTRIIEDVDPAVVVLDPTLRPSVDATRRSNRRYMHIVPNPLADFFPMEQPWGAAFWKYPT